MRGRISPKTKDRFRKSIRDVLKGLSRKIQVYRQPIKVECMNCYFDKMTGRSTGECKWSIDETVLKQKEWIASHPGEVRFKWFRVGRCPICRGDGYLEIKRKAWADCVVIWNPSRYDNATVYTPAGTEGSTVVQLKTDPKYYDLFKNCSRIIVDGVECRSSRPPILRGLGSQAVLTIEAFTTQKPKLNSGEIIKEYT